MPGLAVQAREWSLYGSGRDGQIRTADLSLRRRPLYPSELRPRTLPLLILKYFSACGTCIWRNSGAYLRWKTSVIGFRPGFRTLTSMVPSAPRE
jgi:hypothetical protein